MAVITYSYGTKRKIDGNLGTSLCQNCRHEIDKVLLREISYVNLFYILPVFRHTKTRGQMCTHCGDVVKMNGGDYSRARKTCKAAAN